MKRQDDQLSKLASIAQLLSVLQRPQEQAQDEDNTRLGMALKFLDLSQGRQQQESQLGIERQRLAQEAAATSQAGDLRKQEFGVEQQHWKDQEATEKEHWSDEKEWRQHQADEMSTTRDNDARMSLGLKMLDSGRPDADTEAEALAKGTPLEQGLHDVNQKHQQHAMDFLDQQIQALTGNKKDGGKIDPLQMLRSTNPEGFDQLIKTKYGGVVPTIQPQQSAIGSWLHQALGWTPQTGVIPSTEEEDKTNIATVQQMAGAGNPVKKVKPDENASWLQKLLGNPPAYQYTTPK